jgi:tetratricopeptide (TPR) repeat protein
LTSTERSPYHRSVFGASLAGGRWLFVIAIAVGLAVSGVPEARADERVERAREHYMQGNAYYKLDKYQEALAEYEQAYIAKADPSFLFNIAQCHRFMGNRAEALKFYRRYLTEQPSSPNRPVAEKHIRDLEAALGATPTLGAATTSTTGTAGTTTAPRAESSGGLRPADRVAAGPSSGAPSPMPSLQSSALPTSAPPAVLEQQPARREEDGGPIYGRWWFWAGVGVAAVAATAVAIAAASDGGPCDAGRVCM